MPAREAVATAGAPKALGPYSQAIRVGQLLFVSGQVAIDPATGNLVEGDAAAQARRVLLNIGEILNAAGATFGNVARATLFLADLKDFAAVNEVYGQFFPAPAPARSTVEVSRLPKDSRLEIDVIAVLP
jgi:2-iminobutanoate/2-iminopropanoate deaminase